MKATMNPYQQYKTNQIDTADPKKLIIMLYEGALKFLAIATEAILDYKTYDTANANILRAQDILTELMLSLDLDRGGEIGQNLFNIYSFMKKELLDANIKKDRKNIDNVIKLLNELKEAWDSVDASATIASSSVAAMSQEEYKPFVAEG